MGKETKPSKAIEKLVKGQLKGKKEEDFEPEFGYRDRIRAYYRRPDKVFLTEKDREVIKRAERVQEILMANRRYIDVARGLIKNEFGFTNNMQVTRAIEDAEYLYGAMYHQNKNYQRMLMHQDIEEALAGAKAEKDWIAVEAFLKLRMRLYQLDEPDQGTEVEYFSIIEINMQFNDDEFKHTLKPGWRKRILDQKQKLMQQLGMIEDVKDAEYSDGD